MEDVKTPDERIEALEAQIADLQSDLDGFDVSEHVDESDYDEWLDEMGPVSVCGMDYDVSDVLRHVDPTAYRCGFSDYCDGLCAGDFDAYQAIEDEIADLQSDLEDLEEERDAIDEDE